MNEELVKSINMLFKEDAEYACRLLDLDGESIRELITKKEKITDEEIVNAIENNDLENIYQKAKRNVLIQKLYIDLIQAHGENVLTSKKK